MKKILIVEDELDTVKVLKKRLASEGFEVVIAVDSYQGIRLANSEEPDLVILDLMLPAGGGLSVLKNIRLSTKNQLTPIVVLTGMKDDAYKKQVLEAGVDAYMEKPYDPKELIATIRKLLNQ